MRPLADLYAASRRVAANWPAPQRRELVQAGAIPVVLATKLQNNGFNVDFTMPWDQGHGGDYDLDELFAWMKQVCR